MQVFGGESVFGGIAIGKIRVYQKLGQQLSAVKKINITDKLAEAARFGAAKEQGAKQLECLYENALQQVGAENAAIFEAHRMLIEDPGYSESVIGIIEDQGVCAEYAVAAVGAQMAGKFAAMEDDYMRERAADMQDISERLVKILSGSVEEKPFFAQPVIVVAEELTPSEIVQFDKSKVLALVLTKGGIYSHAAILAKAMGIPTLAGTQLSSVLCRESERETLPELFAALLQQDLEGKLGIVDGSEGLFYIEPDRQTLLELQKRQSMEQEQRALLQQLKGQETITQDGQQLLLCANISSIEDLSTAIQNDAEGIGLFRSEVIYLERAAFPTEEEQFQIYRQVLEAMAGKPVVIRTLDIGADKQCDYFKLEPEVNPALGCRGIRVSLTYPEVFKTQLRALLRASAFGRLAIMYPMITSVGEVRRIKELVALVKKELREAEKSFGEPKQGIMIETPAAVMISEELAKEVDFFSIGTNDLTQYTLALDRQNEKLSEFYDPHHPAVLRMIAMTVENAHKAGIPVSICGELAADQTLTREFLAMGVDGLSVSPGSILPLRKLVREMNAEKA